MTGKSPLPDGCEFWIWTKPKKRRGRAGPWISPRYVFKFRGRPVILTNGEGDILMFLMSRPGQHVSLDEIAGAVYGDREDGGPVTAKRTIQTQISHMVERFHYNSMNLLIKNPATNHGYMFRGVEMIQPPARSRPRRLDTFTEVYAGRGSAP